MGFQNPPLATGVTGTLPVANGGTGVTTSTGANSVVLRDASANVTANNFFDGFTSVAAAGTTTTLTAASTPSWLVTGSGGQTFKLPDATTLPNGAEYQFNNNQSSGTIVVQNNSGTTIYTVQSGAFVTVTVTSNSTAAGTWDAHPSIPSAASWSTNTLSWAGSYTGGTWNGNAIGAIYGGTGVTGFGVVTSKTASYAVLAADSYKDFDNNGAAGSVTFTLPASTVGLAYGFAVMEAQDLVIDAPGGVTIYLGEISTTAGGTITSNAVGSYLFIKCRSSTEWIAQSSMGTWTPA